MMLQALDKVFHCMHLSSGNLIIIVGGISFEIYVIHGPLGALTPTHTQSNLNADHQNFAHSNDTHVENLKNVFTFEVPCSCAVCSMIVLL